MFNRKCSIISKYSQFDNIPVTCQIILFKSHFYCFLSRKFEICSRITQRHSKNFLYAWLKNWMLNSFKIFTIWTCNICWILQTFFHLILLTYSFSRKLQEHSRNVLQKMSVTNAEKHFFKLKSFLDCGKSFLGKFYVHF